MAKRRKNSTSDLLRIMIESLLFGVLIVWGKDIPYGTTILFIMGCFRLFVGGAMLATLLLAFLLELFRRDTE